MDSLAVSVTGGAVIRNCTFGNIMKVGTVMGVFQAGMTLIGYAAGMTFERYITFYDHWIAFGLLLYLGSKMIYDSTLDDKEECEHDPLCNKTLCGLAIATSIDALAIGVSLAILNTTIFLQASTIGVVTFLFSAFGVYFGSRVGSKVDLKLDLIGGIILIAIGGKILAEHTIFA